MLDRLRSLYHREPARLIALLVAFVLFISNRVGLVLDGAGLVETIGLALFVLLGGEATRSQVTPTPGPVGPDSDELLPVIPRKVAHDED
jgi:hypothetical protein